MTTAPMVCPCCPLHCDDLEPARLSIGKTGCIVADKRIQAVIGSSSRAVIADEINTCRQWIAEAHHIVVTGHVIDLETSRGISVFVQATGAEVEVVGSNPMSSQMFARDGAFLTTLGELSARDASVLLIGDVATHWPRIEERLRVEQLSQLFPKPPTAQPSTDSRTLVRWSDSIDLPSRLAALRSQVAGRTSSAAYNDSEFAAAVEFIKTSTYLVLLVAPLQESISRSPVIWSSILGLVRERNKVSRAAILSFDPSMTVRNVIAARNDPPSPRHPQTKSTLRIEFSPFGELVPCSPGRTIVIGLTDKRLGINHCLLPASVPGLHHAGMVIRGDGSVTLPLQSCLDHLKSVTSYPTPAEQLRQLLSS